MSRIFVCFVMISIIGCSPKVRTNLAKKYSPLSSKDNVLVIGITEDLPLGSEVLGTVKISDTGFSTHCGWEIVLEKAKDEARKAGGNVLKIIEHIPPSALGSSCHRIKAQILKIEYTDELKQLINKNSPKIDSTWDYAKLYVYRPSGQGFLINYNVHLGDTVLCRVKNKSKQMIKITKKGMNSLWAKTESKSEIPIDIEFGREYYLRCTIDFGLMIGRPKLQLVDMNLGKLEYENIKN